MGLIVQKYGGTSVGDAERIRKVAARLIATQKSGHNVVAVISAMAGVTDSLIKLAREMSPQPTVRELDALLATGEQGASALTAMAINALGGKAISLTGAAAGIVTDGMHTKAKISHISPRQINELLAEDYIVIVAGFQGQSPEGAVTTLGRGGSDLTAIALAAALKADDCQIFTDVDGVHTCDPRVVPDSSRIDEIAHDELLEMAGAGAKVMQPRAVEFAKKFGVDFEVRSSLTNKGGTKAKAAPASMEDVVVRGISLDRKQAKVTISGVPDRPGCAGVIFSAIAEANLSIDVIVQSVSSTNATDLSFTLPEEDFALAEKILTPLVTEIGA
ncbi:MAG TPA: aspartate kinase, partial [Chthoniobacterales bacterium]